MFFIVKDINIYYCIHYYFCHIASYTDDNTPYISVNNITEVVHCSEKVTDTLFKWFIGNPMKSNTDKCHLVVSTNNIINIKIGNIDITNSFCEKLSGVKFDHKPTFGDHISELCKKASKKIHELPRVTPHMNLLKKRILMNAFFNSQFNYCPLIWMCHSRTNNSKYN